MEKPVKTTKTEATAKENQIYVDGKLQFESNKRDETIVKVPEYQIPENLKIEVVNHKDKDVLLYSKNTHQRNWRVTKGDYEKFLSDQQKQIEKQTTAEEVTE